MSSNAIVGVLLSEAIFSRCLGFLLDNHGPLKIASFNIQVFGQSKFGNTEVMYILVQILSRYDVIVVLEIRDSKGTAFEGLRDELNTYVRSLGSRNVYDSVVSGRLGRTSAKEQYGFLYKPSRVSVSDTYQYPDRHDYFEREPFGVRFTSQSTVVTDFGLLAIHVKPGDAVEEIDRLSDVYRVFNNHWEGVEGIIISGDFNADCNYLGADDWDSISLRTDPGFLWLIADDDDTTVGKTYCSYDRFVARGDGFPGGIVTGSAKVYRFEDEMSLTHDLSTDVSDHYPIEMELKAA